MVYVVFLVFLLLAIYYDSKITFLCDPWKADQFACKNPANKPFPRVLPLSSPFSKIYISK